MADHRDQRIDAEAIDLPRLRLGQAARLKLLAASSGQPRRDVFLLERHDRRQERKVSVPVHHPQMMPRRTDRYQGAAGRQMTGRQVTTRSRSPAICSRVGADETPRPHALVSTSSPGPAGTQHTSSAGAHGETTTTTGGPGGGRRLRWPRPRPASRGNGRRRQSSEPPLARRAAASAWGDRSAPSPAPSWIPSRGRITPRARSSSRRRSSARSAPSDCRIA